jgi:hypothetical protein
LERCSAERSFGNGDTLALSTGDTTYKVVTHAGVDGVRDAVAITRRVSMY